MSLWDTIRNYKPVNPQEEHDRKQMLEFIEHNGDYLERENLTGHFTASMWTVNKARTKTLMAYHNIYDSWAWIGGHADGMEDLCAVAMKELQEETGVNHARLVSEEVFSLETLTVDGHVKRGVWVPSHLHFNLTYLAEAEEEEKLVVREDENSAVQWWTFEEALKVSTEPWMVEYIYKKLIEKLES
ncbi:MAG: NUDIX hydrolase [Eubacteriales bacterium]|nr:NUDIX hydrolase [Eubacteriales bacterium]